MVNSPAATYASFISLHPLAAPVTTVRARFTFVSRKPGGAQRRDMDGMMYGTVLSVDGNGT